MILKFIDIAALEIPANQFPIMLIFSDGNGFFNFQTTPKFIEALAQHPQKERMEFIQELTSKFIEILLKSNEQAPPLRG